MTDFLEFPGKTRILPPRENARLGVLCRHAARPKTIWRRPLNHILKATSALAALMSLTAAGCSAEKQADTTPSDGTSAAALTESTSAPQAAADKGPELGAFGVKIEDMDPTVAPGDDFFQHVGGKWMDSFEIPSDRSS